MATADAGSGAVAGSGAGSEAVTGIGAAGGDSGSGGGIVCVLCGHAGRGEVLPFRMTHGVCVWLCPVHGAPGYLRRNGGRTFAERLTAIWKAAGSFTARKAAALAGHRTRMVGPQKADLPGSYSWPDLRRDAEARFAAGDDPNTVIREFRERFAAWPARVPSVRTMRRWYADGRWFTAKDKPRKTVLGIPRPLMSRWDATIPFDWGWFALLHLWWIDDRPDHPRRN